MKGAYTYLAFVLLMLTQACQSGEQKFVKSDQDSTNITKTYKSGVLKNISYGPHKDQDMDLYLPGNNSIETAIVYIHGGGWFTGDKTEAINWARFFQARGYTFISVNYRLTNTDEHFIYPDQVEDVKNAIEYISSRVGQWGIDKRKIVIMGASAGAQLALLYAFRFNSGNKIRVAISFCGITDLTDQNFWNTTSSDSDPGGRTMISWYVGNNAINRPEILKEASPVNYINKNSIPTLLIHGKADEVVSYEQSLNVSKKLSEFNIPNQLELLEGVDHDFLAIDLSQQLIKADLFIQSILKSH